MTQAQFDEYISRWTATEPSTPMVDRMYDEFAKGFKELAVNSDPFTVFVVGMTKHWTTAAKENNAARLYGLCVCLLSIGAELHSIQLAEQMK